MPNSMCDGRTVSVLFLAQSGQSCGDEEHGECKLPSAKRHESTRKLDAEFKGGGTAKPRPKPQARAASNYPSKRAATKTSQFTDVRQRSTIEADRSAGGWRRAPAQSHQKGQKRY